MAAAKQSLQELRPQATYEKSVATGQGVDEAFMADLTGKPRDEKLAASSSQPWCRVEPASGTGASTHVNVTVDANKTGASRTAKIKFKTADGRGSDTMTVFQSQY